MRRPALHQTHQVAQITSLTQRLGQATQGQNWSVLHELDRELAGLLTDLRGEDSWGPDLSKAMVALRAAHLEAMLQCAMASEAMATRLSATLSAKEGWMAYAANSEWNGGQA